MLHRHGRGVCHDFSSSAVAGHGQQLPAGTATVLDVVAHLGGVWDERQTDADEAAQQGGDTAGLKNKSVFVNFLLYFSS